ncbi:MAG: DNA topoisomerase IV subunit A [Alphaproteobacteria bacterium]
MLDDPPAFEGNDPNQHQIQETPIALALSERYLAYALSTITSRSLPDGRDGLKPVHRRLLFAMRELKLNPASGYKKCARIVGDVMGKYHPHGDQAIYDAMVRLAQDFAVRYPLVEGQGNFGNVDGDNPAAMRYTEARLTQTALQLLEGIDEDMVDFRQTYDSEGEEPVVLPAAFPNLLANGASGIAVGMATNIPPHNILELLDALLHLIKHPECDIAALLQHIKGPDFPTGGQLIESEAAILNAYKTGKGSFRIRANYQVEKQKNGGYELIIDQIPYQVQKSKLIERLAELALSKENPLLEDVRDESAEDIRIVLVPKSRNVAPELLMEALYRQSELETRFSLNMNMLVEHGKAPKLLNLKQALQEFLNHRQDVLLRRGQHRTDTINRRLHLLQGYIICHLNLDEVIRIIRESDHPKPELIKAFNLDDVQAEAILNMRLRALRKLEELELKREAEALEAERDALTALAESSQLQWKKIAGDLKSLKKYYDGVPELSARRTMLGQAVEGNVEFDESALIEKEPITVICSKKGWIRSFKGHLSADGLGQVKYKDGDGARFVLLCQTTDKLLLFATNGRAYTLSADKLPSGRGTGEPFRLMIELESDHDLMAIRVLAMDEKLIIASSDGYGFVVEAKNIVAQTRNGKQVLNLSAGAQCAAIAPAEGDSVAIISTGRKLLIFALDELPEMGKGRGVRLQKYRDGQLSDLKSFNHQEGLCWRIGERERREMNLLPFTGKRAQTGRLPPAGFPRSNKFN